MPQVSIIMPQLGESIAEATVITLLVRVGDVVEADQDIIEVETNKAIMNIAAPCRGRVGLISAHLNESYPVGGVLGYLEISQEDARRMGRFDELHPAKPDPQSPDTEDAGPGKRQVLPTVRGLPVPTHAAGASYLSPRMRARMHELGLHAGDLAGLAGSGAAGRVTIEDFEKFLTAVDKQRVTKASSMRVAVADAMRRSWTRPLAMVALPLNIDPVMAHRQSSHSKAGMALYSLRALAIALGENSAPAGRLIGHQIVHPSAIDLGFAVETAEGVLVPVVRGADRKPLSALVETYNSLVELARQGRLTPDSTGNSVATVTNFGTFGLTLATPIPLPEQSLVLGIGVGRKVPHWDDASQSFVPVSEANLTLSFDHRVLDGGAAGRLLQRIAALLSHPDSL